MAVLLALSVSPACSRGPGEQRGSTPSPGGGGLRPGRTIVLRITESPKDCGGPAQARDQVMKVLRRRLEEYGERAVDVVPDPLDLGKIRVESGPPQVDDAVRRLLTGTQKLELRLVEGSTDGPGGSPMTERLGQWVGAPPPGCERLPVRPRPGGSDQEEKKFLAVRQEVVIDNRNIVDAEAQKERDPYSGPGLYSVRLRLDAEGAERFGQFTASHIDRQLAVVLDGTVLFAPTIRSKITDSAIITNLSSPAEAQALAASLRAGLLPAKIVIEAEW